MKVGTKPKFTKNGKEMLGEKGKWGDVVLDCPISDIKFFVYMPISIFTYIPVSIKTQKTKIEK